MQPSAPAPTTIFGGRDAVPLGERLVQPIRAAVGVAVQVAGRALERLAGGGERPERPFVRRELDDAVEPELALALLDRLPRLVRRQRADARAKERIGDVERAATHAVSVPASPAEVLPPTNATVTEV